MTEYPRLAEMGVLHPQHIVYFSVNSLEFTDHLRIFYERPKGSLLPTSRTYKFPRVQKKLESGKVAKGSDVVMESNPALREAVAELDALLGVRESKDDLASTMLKELRQLEEDVSIRTDCVKNLVEKMRAL